MKKLLPWHELPPRKIPKACYESRNRALTILIVRAEGIRQKNDGDASVGSVRMDAGEMFLREVEARGTAHVRGLRIYLDRVWNSEARLKRFLIRLAGRWRPPKKRRVIPDWSQGVDQTERFIVEGWCESIIVDGEAWPPLCCLTHGATQKFSNHCKRPLATGDSDINFRQKIRRLGLVGIPKGRIKQVEKKFGQFLFA